MAVERFFGLGSLIGFRTRELRLTPGSELSVKILSDVIRVKKLA